MFAPREARLLARLSPMTELALGDASLYLLDLSHMSSWTPWVLRHETKRGATLWPAYVLHAT